MKRISLKFAFEQVKSTQVVLLDIDGTLCADHDDVVRETESELVEFLKSQNKQVYLCTNSPFAKRNEKIAMQLQVPLLTSNAKKPFKGSLQKLPIELKSGPFVVIGDKWLTDGLFALRIGAELCLVERIRSGRERWWMKGVFLIDDLIGAFVYTAYVLIQRQK